MLKRTLLTAALVVSSTALLPACTRPLWVNIPPQEGDLASHDPNSETVREVMAKAVLASLDEMALPGPAVLVLPEGSDSITKADVANQIGDAVVLEMDNLTANRAIEVVGVRIRGDRALVDVQRPGRGGFPIMHVVELRKVPMGDWTFDNLTSAVVGDPLAPRTSAPPPTVMPQPVVEDAPDMEPVPEPEPATETETDPAPTIEPGPSSTDEDMPEEATQDSLTPAE